LRVPDENPENWGASSEGNEFDCNSESSENNKGAKWVVEALQGGVWLGKDRLQAMFCGRLNNMLGSLLSSIGRSYGSLMHLEPIRLAINALGVGRDIRIFG